MKRARLTMDVVISSTRLELDTGHRKVSSTRPNLPFDNLILRQRFLVLPRDVVSLIHETEPARCCRRSSRGDEAFATIRVFTARKFCRKFEV
ncbi:unnamed protein product [Sphagnum balticum]